MRVWVSAYDEGAAERRAARARLRRCAVQKKGEAVPELSNNQTTTLGAQYSQPSCMLTEAIFDKVYGNVGHTEGVCWAGGCLGSLSQPDSKIQGQLGAFARGVDNRTGPAPPPVDKEGTLARLPYPKGLVRIRIDWS